jgi:hypothetical protein
MKVLEYKKNIEFNILKINYFKSFFNKFNFSLNIFIDLVYYDFLKN